MTILSGPRDYSRCTVTNDCTRRIFWSTQPDACAGVEVCDTECTRPGLRLLTSTAGATIDTSNYVRGLAINILGTDGAVSETECGVRPGNRGGHWSQIFAGSNVSFGSRIRFLNVACSITLAPRTIASQLELELQKIVTYGVARSVAVEGTYAGRGVVRLVITITGSDGQSSNVALSGTRLANAWAWN